ncbi:hypothetical protein AMTRI_Chr02g212140 [Amborella trichopoda]
MADLDHLDKMGRELKCPICLSLLNSAVSLTCNHVFCNLCISKYMKTGSNCPVCKVPYHRREIRPAPHMDNLVSIYKSMEVASGVKIFVTQTAQATKEEEKPNKSSFVSDAPKETHKSHGNSKKQKRQSKRILQATDELPSEPSNPAKKRVQVSLYPPGSSETPILYKKISKCENKAANNEVEGNSPILKGKKQLISNGSYENNGSIVPKEKPIFDEKGNPIFSPFFWLRDEDDEEKPVSQQTENALVLETPPHGKPSFSDLKDSDDDISDKKEEQDAISKAADMFDSEMFEWTQRACSPELCPTPSELQQPQNNGIQDKSDFYVTCNSDFAESANLDPGDEKLDLCLPDSLHQQPEKSNSTLTTTKRTENCSSQLQKKHTRGSLKQPKNNETKDKAKDNAIHRAEDAKTPLFGHGGETLDVGLLDSLNQQTEICNSRRTITKLKQNSGGKVGKFFTRGSKRMSKPQHDEIKDPSVDVQNLIIEQGDKKLDAGRPDTLQQQAKIQNSKTTVTGRKRKSGSRAGKHSRVECTRVKKSQNNEVNDEAEINETHPSKDAKDPIFEHGDEKVDAAFPTSLHQEICDSKITTKRNKPSSEVGNKSIKGSKRLKTITEFFDVPSAGPMTNVAEKTVEMPKYSVSVLKPCLHRGISDDFKVNAEVHSTEDVIEIIHDRICCAFCQADSHSQVSGKILHHVNGKAVEADYKGMCSVIHAHKNCAEWAPNVYFMEDIAMNLECEVSRGRKIKCSSCGIKGATLGCYEKSCRKSFHFPCAKSLPQCRWDEENFVMLCPAHSSSKLPKEISKAERNKRNNSLSKMDPQPPSINQSGNASKSVSKKQWRWSCASSSKWVLCGSALNNAEKEVVSKLANMAGVSVLKAWHPNITHVIASTDENGACRRTLKVLMGIIEGKWIVKIDWIKACLMAMQPVNEDSYEISLDIHGIRDGPCNGRLRVSGKKPKLFNGYEFYFCGDFLASYKKYLQEMVTASGGTVLQRKPILKKRENSIENVTQTKKTFIIYSLELPEKSNSGQRALIMDRRRAEAHTIASGLGAQAIGHSWILDSIAACKLQNLHS